MFIIDPFRLCLPNVNYYIFDIKLDLQWPVGVMEEMTFTGTYLGEDLDFTPETFFKDCSKPP